MEYFSIDQIVENITKNYWGTSPNNEENFDSEEDFRGRLFKCLIEAFHGREIKAYNPITGRTMGGVFGLKGDETVFYTTSYDVNSWFKDNNLTFRFVFANESDNKSCTDDTHLYRDKNHPMYSEELNIAIDGWLAVLESNPARPKQGSRKQLIEAWLEEKHGKTQSTEAKRRIATLINPDKGGPPPSS